MTVARFCPQCFDVGQENFSARAWNLLGGHALVCQNVIRQKDEPHA